MVKVMKSSCMYSSKVIGNQVGCLANSSSCYSFSSVLGLSSSPFDLEGHGLVCLEVPSDCLLGDGCHAGIADIDIICRGLLLDV